MRVFVSILLLIFSFSCGGRGKEKIVDILSIWQDKEVVFPKNVIFTRYGKDTLDYKIPTSKYKILLYVDSGGCTSCKLQLLRWKSFIQYLNSNCKDSISVLLFFHTKDKEKIWDMLKWNDFDLPVSIDYEDSLNILNNFPREMILQTFLLDENNKVKIIGNPVYNTKIKDLYTKLLIDDNLLDKLESQSAIKIDYTCDFGIIESHREKSKIFYLKNTNTIPMVIIDVIASCNCVVVEYDKHSAVPGDSLKVVIKLMPKEKMYFEETIIVKNNISLSPVRLLIKGHVL